MQDLEVAEKKEIFYKVSKHDNIRKKLTSFDVKNKHKFAYYLEKKT